MISTVNSPTVADVPSLLGIGLYTPQEASLYARVSTRLMNRWLFGDGTGESVIRPQLGQIDDERTVTFLDLVQALSIRAIRTDYKIPLQKIREAVEHAQDQFGIQYPFATQHTTYLLSDGMKDGHGEIVIQIQGRDEDPRMIQISGRNSGNYVIRQVAEYFSDDLHFAASGLADLWTPLKLDDDAVTLNPRVRFGEPMIQSCGITARTLFEAVHSEGSILNAADAYGVEASAVKLACRYFDNLKSPAA